MSTSKSRLLAVSLLALLALDCGQQPQPLPPATPPAVSQLLPAEPPGEDRATAAPVEPANRAPDKVAAKHLPNPWRLHPKVISGDLPVI